MHQACHLRVTGSTPITTLALAIGYNHHIHFTHGFRKLFGVAPRLYRQRWSRSG